MEDFFVGGKSLGYWVVALSSRATGESAWLLLGLTGMGAMMGVKAFWVVVGEVAGVSLAWFFMAKPFKRLTDSYKSITIPDFLVSHFNPKTHVLRGVAAIILAVFVTIYVSAQIDATGSAFETFFGWNYFVGAIVGFAIVVAYIFTGGFLAVAWSDLFQGSMMFFGLLMLPIAGLYSLFNMDKLAGLMDQIVAIDPNLLSFWGAGGFTLMNLMGIIGFLMIGIGFLGSPQVFVRFISVKNEAEINKGRWVAIFYTLITDASAVAAGLIGRVLLVGPDKDAVQILGNGAQDVLPMMVEMVFPSIMVAIYVAVVLSAIMSTIDSLLVVASSAVTRDYYQQILHPELKQENLARLSQYVTLGMALFALAIAMIVAVCSPTRTIFWFVIFGWSGISASFCPLIILSLFWKKYTEAGALASMITGFLCVPFFKFVVPGFATVGPYFSELSELPPSFAMAMLVGVGVSFMTQPSDRLPANL